MSEYEYGTMDGFKVDIGWYVLSSKVHKKPIELLSLENTLTRHSKIRVTSPTDDPSASLTLQITNSERLVVKFFYGASGVSHALWPLRVFLIKSNSDDLKKLIALVKAGDWAAGSLLRHEDFMGK